MSQATTSLNLFQANRQWAQRPADERFWTLAEARNATKAYADVAEEPTIDFAEERLLVDDDGDNLVLSLDGGKCRRTAAMTHWGFGQIARLAGAPAEYLRKLPAHLAASCLEHGLDEHFKDRHAMTAKALVHANGTTVLRSLTSERYSRFWNWEVFDRLLGLEAEGWRVPPARPASGDDPRARPATEADVLKDRKGGGGVSVNVGDLIAPAGVYASDHDLFAFLVNEQYRIDDGSEGGLARGFFVQNSEVGASALRVTMFLYRHVCGNHIVWDAKNVMEVAVRHVGDVAGRFHVELSQTVEKYLAASGRDETARIARARRLELGATKDEVLDAVFKAVAAGRRAGLPSGLNLKQLDAAYVMAEAHADTDGSPRSVWGYVNGLTRLSQQTPYADDRNFLDRAGSAVLALAV
jgi:hypothetical protein